MNVPTKNETLLAGIFVPVSAEEGSQKMKAGKGFCPLS